MDWLETAVSWQETSEPEFPYVATVYGQNWVLRINDFPEEPLYTLIINDEVIISFDGWPNAWSRNISSEGILKKVLRRLF